MSKIITWGVDLLATSSLINRFLPRWVIFGADMLLTFGAFVLTIGLYRLLSPVALDGELVQRLALILPAYGLAELALGIYRRTVRFSTLMDMVRLLSSILLAVAFLLLLVRWEPDYWPSLKLTSTFILAHAATTFILLFIFRVVVKVLYYAVGSFHHQRRRVLIFGADGNAISMAQVLATDTDAVFKPVALLCRDERRMELRLGTVPVVRMPSDPEELIKIVHRFKANGILFRDDQVKELPQVLMDALLEAQVKLFVAGETESYQDQQKRLRVSVNEIRIEDLLDREVIKTENVVVIEKHRGRVVLVTGAAGSIGSEVVRQVATFAPSQLILLDQAESPLYEIELYLKKYFPELNVLIYIADVRHAPRVEELFERYRPEIIYHAAAYKHVPMMEMYPAEAIRVNVMGTRLLADLAVKYEARKFVMVSTDKAVNPTNVMGASKRIAEMYVQSLFLSLEPLTKAHRKRTRFITTRFGNVLGSNGSVVPLFKDQIAKGGPVTLTHKEIIRYFMTIPEACRLVLEAGCMGRGGEIFIFDMGEPVKIYDLAKRMILLSGLRPHKDIAIVETGLRPGEKLYEELLNNEEQTLPTHHEKIMVAKVRTCAYDTVSAQIDTLVDLAKSGDHLAVVRQMKVIVPEFKSKNSLYEALDEPAGAEEAEVKASVNA